MKAAGYDDYITAEVSMMVQRRDNYNPFEAAELAYHTLAAAFATSDADRS